jgi:hypothetical protein
LKQTNTRVLAAVSFLGKRTVTKSRENKARKVISVKVTDKTAHHIIAKIK